MKHDNLTPELEEIAKKLTRDLGHNSWAGFAGADPECGIVLLEIDGAHEMTQLVAGNSQGYVQSRPYHRKPFGTIAQVFPCESKIVSVNFEKKDKSGAAMIKVDYTFWSENRDGKMHYETPRITLDLDPDKLTSYKK